MEASQRHVNSQQNSTLNENQPGQHNNAHERQASQQKFNKFLVAVPHCEIKAQLDAEKRAKRNSKEKPL